MISADHHNIDRQLNIKLVRAFALQLDFLEGQATADALVGNILKQARHLGITGQLADQRTKGAFHVFHLLAIGIQVGRLVSLVFKIFF